MYLIGEQAGTVYFIQINSLRSIRSLHHLKLSRRGTSENGQFGASFECQRSNRFLHHLLVRTKLSSSALGGAKTTNLRMTQPEVPSQVAISSAYNRRVRQARE